MGNKLSSPLSYFSNGTNNNDSNDNNDDNDDEYSSSSDHHKRRQKIEAKGGYVSVLSYHDQLLLDHSQVLQCKALFQAFGEHQFEIQGNINANISKYVQGSEYIVKIASGGHHTVLLTSLGRILSFGKNLDGQVGWKTELNHSNDIGEAKPLYKYTNEFAVDVCCGNNHTVILTNLGNLMGCGWNAYGQLAEGPHSSQSLDYIKFKAKIRMVRAGNNATCILDADGRLYLSGTLHMTECRLGEFTLMDDFSAKLSKHEKIVDFQVGGRQVVAVSSKNKVFILGEDYIDRGGSNYKRFTNVTSKLGFDPIELKSFSVGLYHCLFLTHSGRMYATGYNGYGQLGTGDFQDLNTPKEITKFYKVDPESIKKGITAEQDKIEYYECAVAKDPEFYSDVHFIEKNEFITSILAGSCHSLFVSNLGTIYGCGYNAYGQLVLPLEVVDEYDDDAVPEPKEKNPDVKQLLIDTTRSSNFILFSNSAANITILAEKQAINLWMYKCLKNRAIGGELGDVVFSFDQ
ncbi:predicted protein [Naegleria gruberi]|uniref:Predicted protein n=1 Tax=Naegleria gruberi TaxID=5762 RepID=D2W3S0_NAEGR|nr:uncharacterized protein NAEGRDRAFT_76045 [Naegleria gruberi]EFC36286.1 predicted protein [Naegleria gruberi]|eukprot:XP_002669030.1 predicted protein [Naegleria gruberi strain NEG-M]